MRTLHHVWFLNCLLRRCERIKFHRRFYASSQYSSTVLLPSTTFSKRIGANKVSQHEQEIQKVSKFDDLYSKQFHSSENKRVFVLHDGPPYANGDVHVGHALNKILKDIVNRYKLLTGHRVHYKPGWDCHGLPIEIKAIKTKDYSIMTPLQIRQVAKKFASDTIEQQMKAFKRWGVMADWNNPTNCYYTFEKSYEVAELSAFYELYKKGLVYRNMKPVHWSPSSRTALAESELEYNEKHISRSVYTVFQMPSVPSVLAEYGNNRIQVVTWTTQPWTLASNWAICFSEKEIYCLVRRSSESSPEPSNVPSQDLYLMAEKCIDPIAKEMGCSFQVLKTIEGKHFNGFKCVHPMDPDRLSPLLSADHVSMELGSGFVHTSPAHGAEDFKIAQAHGLDYNCAVDDNGRFTAEAGYNLAGKFIFQEGNQAVIDILKERQTLLCEHNYTHSYPYDWRTKKPVFVKTSKQWFVDTGSLHEKANQALEEVNFYPPTGKKAMLNQLKLRSYWCISRQRVWGFPIPVFYHKVTGDVLINDDTIDHLLRLFSEHGTDCWWEFPVGELLPQDVLDRSGAPGSCDDYSRGEDILDIWFDSGVSWRAVLSDVQRQNSPAADFYVEGIDQYGGWFHSSLLTGIGLEGKAPYRNLLVHGFAVAENGTKMSKSLGNVVDPMVLIEGGKKRGKHPAFGADALRWWVATSGVHQQVHCSTNLVSKANDAVQKIRSTCRFLLSNLNDYDPKSSKEGPPKRAIDQYFMYLLSQYIKTVERSFENYHITSAAIHAQNFATTLSNLYFSAIKDRLYCEEEHGELRNSCRSVLLLALNVLVKSIAPILPHLAEEIVMHHPCPDWDSAFSGGWCDVYLPACRYSEKTVAAVETALKIRDAFNSLIPGKNQIEYDVTVYVTQGPLLDQLTLLQETESSHFSDLCEIVMPSQCSLVTSEISAELKTRISIELDDAEHDCLVYVLPSSSPKCPRCRRKTAPASGHLCQRCTDVLSDPWAK